jgi:signal transduction histidine kinase
LSWPLARRHPPRLRDCAYLIEIYLISFPLPVRYSIGWYAGRVFGLVSGSLVLFVLLYEITMLYAQLLRAVLAQRREREARLMTGDAVAATIVHEVKQPLSGMITNADAGLRWLDRPTPDLDEAKAAFKQIAAAGHRAAATLATAIRAAAAAPLSSVMNSLLTRSPRRRARAVCPVLSD